MVNRELLQEKIKRSGYSQFEVAELIGISETSFSLKLNGKSEFKVSEADKLCNILKIKSSKNRCEIFFASDVPKIEQR